MTASLFLAGCGNSGTDRGPETDEQRKKSVFWQMEQPKIQMDPVSEEEIPSVFSPTGVPEGEEK